ncbi:type I Iterative Polyketide synthase (PKS) [Aspergillus niger]|nr:type I Iterative Polyketide synthase (PKS) [Aspergillus niger]
MDNTSSCPEPIAVIGLGCRFAGQAASLDGFWEMLRDGRKEHGPVPASRYQAAAWKHPSHERKGAINHDSGFFLEEDPARFDAPFFSITAKEAAGMDPAQRLLLEVAYEAFENAGVPMESLPGSSTGVYSGCMTNDYELLSTRDIMDMPHNSATGNGRTMLANRISWFFDLRGPSIMMDTACSSSLTALHLATQALRAGECRMALVCGASIILHPNFTQRLSYMHMLSADGISHSFDSRANGYGRGEGLGAVLLKPLSQAMADGDVIRAIVRATGANQDGRTPGITMPNAEAQADLIQATYRQVGLSMRETAYFEAHGTGTALGDPTELSAIGASFGKEHIPTDEPVYVGSVKSNIGHTEGAAGVASLIKVVLCLEKATLVPNAGFVTLNPKIQTEKWRLRLSDITQSWPSHLPQRASINSFGFGGANAHAILESLTQYLGTIPQAIPRSPTSVPQLVMVSTHDKAGLDRTAQKWTHTLEESSENPPLVDLAHTMATRRSKFGFRSFAVADSIADLQEAMGRGLPSFQRARREQQTSLAFVCTGQGAQWAGMGIELLAFPVFAASIHYSQKVLTGLGCPWDLAEEIRAHANTSRINRPDRSQPVCCALQIALIDLLTDWSVVPKAVVGHSSGEVGAAYAAGYLTHEDAIKVTYFRGVFSQSIVENGPSGGMLAAGLPAETAREYLHALSLEDVVVACINSPSSVTLSGNENQIDQLAEYLQAKGLFARKLRVDTAYHSPYMRALADDYRDSIASIKPVNLHQGKIAMFSSVTKTRIQHPEELGPDYWIRNLVSPVEFATAVGQLATMSESGPRRRRPVGVPWVAILEIGPHEALKGPFTQTVQEVNASLTSLPYLSLVQRRKHALHTSLQVAGVLWSIGCPLEIDRINRSLLGDYTPRPSQALLPSYAWNHQSRYWHEPYESTQLRQRNQARHDLLGVACDYQNNIEPRWRNFLRLSEHPWLADHVVAGSIVLPAAGMVAIVAEAARQLADSTNLAGIEFHDLEFFRGMVISSEENGLEILLQVAPHAVAGWYQFGIFSRPEESPWVQHAKGSFTIEYAGEEEQMEESTTALNWAQMVQQARQTQAAANMAVDGEAVYSWLSDTGGVTMGPTFRTIQRLFFHPTQSRLYASVNVTDTQSTMPNEQESPYFIHPSSLDSLFQAAVLSCSEALSNQNAQIPIAVDRLYMSTRFSPSTGEQFAIHVNTHWDEGGNSRSEVVASHPTWSQPGLVLQGVRLGRVPMQSRSSAAAENTPQSRFSSLVWAEHVDSWADHCDGTLSSWLKSVCHTHGDARMLVVTAERRFDQLVPLLQDFVATGTYRPRLQSLTVILIDVSPEYSAARAQGVQQLLPNCQVLPVLTLAEVGSSLPDDGAYDAILLDHPDLWNGRQDFPLLDDIHKATQPDSWIAAATPMGIRNEVLKNLERHADWEVRGIVTQTDALLIHRRNKSSSMLGPILYVLAPEPANICDALLQELVPLIQEQGGQVERVSPYEVSKLKGKQVISLMELHQSWTLHWTPADMECMRALVQANYLLWVSPAPLATDASYAAAGATTGLLRTLRNENPHLELPQLLIEEDFTSNPSQLGRSIARLVRLTRQSRSRPQDYEYVLRDGRLYIPRAIASSPLDEVMEAAVHGPKPILAELTEDHRPLRLHSKSSDLEGAQWQMDDRLATAIADDEVEVQLQAISLPSTTGKTTEARVPVTEALGTVCHVGQSLISVFSVGETVLCVIPGHTISTRVRLPESSVWTCPPQQGPAQSLSMPVAYSTAYTGLANSMHQFASSVLIVGSADQTLRATVHCALAARMTVLVAVDNAVEELRAQYPVLKDQIISLHRSLPATIDRLTSGRGVQLTICNLGGAVSRQAASCLASGGRYIDLSGDLQLSALPQKIIEQGCTVTSLSLARMLRDTPRLVQANFHRAVDLVAGHKTLVQVASYPVFPVSQMAEASSHARNSGTRVILDLQAPGPVAVVPFQPEPIPLPSENTYLLVGGLGTIGLSLASALVDSGAHHIVFLSRSGAAQPSQQAALEALRARGTRAEVIRCDVASPDDVQNLLTHATHHNWRIRGIIQCATVLKDAMFEQMDWDSWQQSTRAKIQGTWNLHQAFQAPRALDFFITLSSISSVIGNMGQANYAAGNAFMDALMEWRHQHNLAGRSINLGLVEDASGVTDVAESAEQRRQRYRHVLGTEISQAEVQALVRFLVQGRMQSPLPAQIIAGLVDVLPREDGASPWQFDRKFDHRARIANPEAETAAGPVKTSLLLKKAESVDEAVSLVSQALQGYLARAMGANTDSVDLDLPLSALGVDSLKATEMQTWVSRELGAALSSFELLSSQPVRILAEKITAGSSFVAVKP